MSSSATVIATVPNSAAICVLGPRQGHPLALERIARPEMSLLPGHEGAAPERAVGDDRRRHEQIPARIRSRRAGQAPARPKAPGDLQEGAGPLAARILEARGLVDHQHIEQRMIIRNGGEFADQPGHKVDTDHRDLALGSGAQERPPALRLPVENGNAQMLQVRPGRDLLRPHGLGDELRRDDQGVPALPRRGSARRAAVSAAAPLPAPSGAIRKAASRSYKTRCGALLIGTQDAGERRVHLRAAFALV